MSKIDSAELTATISQVAQQAAEAASVATARILRGEAQADRELFERQIAQLTREQVDFIVVGSASTPSPSPSLEPGFTSRNSFATQDDVARIASSQLPPPAQSPPAISHSLVPPGGPSTPNSMPDSMLGTEGQGATTAVSPLGWRVREGSSQR